jgi:hypothetical protein
MAVLVPPFCIMIGIYFAEWKSPLCQRRRPAESCFEHGHLDWCVNHQAMVVDEYAKICVHEKVNKTNCSIEQEGSHQIQNLWNLCDGQILYYHERRLELNVDPAGQAGQPLPMALRTTPSSDD